MRGELTGRHGARRVSWGSLARASTAAREALRKKLEAVAPGPAWGECLEQAAWQFTQTARQGEPLVTLTGRVASPTRELLPRLLYEGEPTLVFGDGDTFDLAEAAPQTLAGASLAFRIRAALAGAALTAAEVAEAIEAPEKSVSAKLRDLKGKGKVIRLDDDPHGRARWGLPQ